MAFDTGPEEMHINIGHLKEEKKEAILIVGMSCANGSVRTAVRAAYRDSLTDANISSNNTSRFIIFEMKKTKSITK